ncbi:MAG: hydantoinase/oxoprolinase family protein [Leucobacter sp.]
MNVSEDSVCISVDTGGTFTDAVVTVGGRIASVGKAPTTYGGLVDGFFGAVENAAEGMGLSRDELFQRADRLVYGTTHTVNAYVQGKTAKTALLTTRGFADTLLFREGGRPEEQILEFNVPFPEPYIPRRHTFEITERIDAEGGVVHPLDEAEVRSTLEQLKNGGFEAVAVSLLWAPANSAHERRVGELIEEMLPGTPYTLSHQLLPIIREYRRASVTSLDASLKPLVEESLGAVESEVRKTGYTGPILLCTSAGGVVPIDHAISHPIYLMKSGPAMAPVAAKRYSELENFHGDVVVVDTGGTTFDLGMIQDGEISQSRITWMGQEGIGDLIAMSTVNIKSIGAGGGSIASVDEGRLLSVGPRSAGSEPGPICYGNGGTEPTVTDAAAVLGYLQPDYFFGGRMTLDVEPARQAILELGKKLGTGLYETAEGIMRLASESMIDAIHGLTVRVGIDPRSSVLVAGGGAAGINIVPIARELGVQKVIVPQHAGVLSAVGMQYSDLKFRSEKSQITVSNHFNVDAVNAALDEIDEKLSEFAEKASGEHSAVWEREYRAEGRYAGQVWEVEFKLPADTSRITEEHVEQLVQAFHDEHRKQYTFTDPDSPVEFINWIGVTRGIFSQSTTAEALSERGALPAPLDTRSTYFTSVEHQSPIYEMDELPAGAQVVGPATIVSPTTTLVVYPESIAEVTPHRDFVITLTQPASDSSRDEAKGNLTHV